MATIEEKFYDVGRMQFIARNMALYCFIVTFIRLKSVRNMAGGLCLPSFNLTKITVNENKLKTFLSMKFRAYQHYSKKFPHQNRIEFLPTSCRKSLQTAYFFHNFQNMVKLQSIMTMCSYK